MSRRHSQRISDSEEQTTLNDIAKQLRELTQWRIDTDRKIEHAQQDRERQITILQDELTIMRDEQSRAKGSRSWESNHEREGFRVGDYYEEHSSSRRHRREPHEPPPPREVNINLLHFYGKDDVEAFLDWEMKVEQLFSCHQISGERKVPLATLSFQGYAMYWWTAIVEERRRHNNPPIQYWNDLINALRRRHILSYYHRELMDKLQRLQQKYMSVEQYKQKMELYMLRAKIEETDELTMARFFSRLNFEIRDRVELLPYINLDSLVQMCIKVEQQILQKTSTKRGHIPAQCPTKRTIILRGSDIYSSESESPTSESENEQTEKEEAFVEEGQLLMHRLVEKLNLVVIPHPKPYKLHWLNEDGDITVKNQVKLEISIGNFKDEVICDIVPMEACHVLLGRPWQFVHNTTHHGLTNIITMHKDDKKFVLHPLSPTQVAKDQA
ncbi:uncharacterized protein LOC108330354 [Vigna angularis]|uniref:uncharacterized protein LOC108330354 n=1 Tax=Phaseolus angularis TaxID=3914 RepID=UPI0022B5603A|nr:uncharacterized protein LOC108330354 [Vigna angularis]